MSSEFDWREALKQLFAATVNQETLESAAQLMVSVSSRDKIYHEECLLLFEKGKELARNRDNAIITFINKSGYQVADFDEALELVSDFEQIYLGAYRDAAA
jgi:hypothetical protein